jgi:hypothetical protein
MSITSLFKPAAHLTIILRGNVAVLDGLRLKISETVLPMQLIVGFSNGEDSKYAVFTRGLDYFTNEPRREGDDNVYFFERWEGRPE